LQEINNHKLSTEEAGNILFSFKITLFYFAGGNILFSFKITLIYFAGVFSSDTDYLGTTSCYRLAGCFI